MTTTLGLVLDLYDLTIDGIDQNCDGIDSLNLNGDGHRRCLWIWRL